MWTAKTLSDWADAQADLSLRWAHNHFVGFVMLQLILKLWCAGRLSCMTKTIMNHYTFTAELLAGFFSYWSAFDFSENVLISRTANSMLIADFLDKDNMKDGRIRNFKVGY